MGFCRAVLPLARTPFAPIIWEIAGIMSRRWSDTTKRWVVTATAIAGAIVLYRVRQVLPPIILTILLAYILNPAVELIIVKAKRSRTFAVSTVYLALIVALGVVLAIFVPRFVQQITAIDVDLQGISETIKGLIADYRTIDVFGFPVDLFAIYEQVRGTLEAILSSLASRTISILRGLASSLVWLTFILIVSFYLLKDAEKIGQGFDDLIPLGYRDEVRQLRGEINDVWSAFLRGQIVLCLVIGAVVWAITGALGVRSSLLLGILAGLLESVPGVGPIIAAIPAVVIALFGGSAYLPFSNAWSALLVAGVYTLIQQVESNYLAPRIIGRRLNLHPLVVFLGVVAGANLAGILGVFLAAPTLATLRVLGRYIYRKVLETEEQG